MLSLRELFYADTQSIESANSIVRLISVRCRKISLELLSARLMIKYSLSYANLADDDSAIATSDRSQLADIDRRYRRQNTTSQMRNKIHLGEELHKIIKPFAQAYQDDSSVSRWAPAALVQLSVSQSQIVAAHPFMRVRQQDVWASSYATALRRCLCPKKPKKKKTTAATGEKPPAAKSSKTTKTASQGQGSKQQSSSASSTIHPDIAVANQSDLIGWPMVVMSLLKKVAGKTEVLSVKWYLWVCNYRYTMSFVEVFLLDARCDSVSFGTLGSEGMARLKCRARQDVVDGSFIFRQHAEAVQEGASLKVERILLPPSSILVESEGLKDSKGLEQKVHPLTNAGDSDLGLDISPEADLILATLPVQALRASHLLTATKEPHVAALPAAPPKGAKEPKVKAVPDGKRKHPQDGDSGDNLEHDSQNEDESMVDLAAHAAAELHGDVELDPEQTDSDPDQDDDLYGKDAVDANNVAKIQAAVKSKKCPPDQAISQVSDIIKSWPQFAELNQTDREEQALILILSGLGQHDAAISDVVTQTTETEPGQSEASASNPADPVSLVGAFDETVTKQLKDDLTLPSSTTFSELNANKPRGPGSLPVGKDFHKQKEIHVSTASVSALKEWQAALKLSAEAIQFRHEHCNDPLGENLSLVLLHESPQREDETAQLIYAHWLKHKPGTVRQAHLDPAGRVIFSVAWQCKPLSLKGPEHVNNTIILPDVGVAMLKVKASERPSISDQVRRLEDMLNTLILQSLPEED